MREEGPSTTVWLLPDRSRSCVPFGMRTVLCGLAVAVALWGCGGSGDGDASSAPAGSGGDGPIQNATGGGAASTGGGAASSGGGTGGTGGGGAGGDGDGTGSGGVVGGSGGGGSAGPGLASLSGCPEVSIQSAVMPDSLACTGPYVDVASKQLAGDVRAFSPAYALWSDGAVKTRFIYLPAGGQIDASDADDWRFPIGTRLFKEFAWKGHRVETRVFWKIASNIWLKAAYRWSADESEATRFDGGQVQVAGDTYEIPTPKMCDQCHKGRTDRALGFEAVSLGLPGATGMTLATLAVEGRLSNHSGPTALSLGDDGTTMGAAALGFLHVNCGVSCHNGYVGSEASKTGMRTRLLPSQLDGRSSADFDAITTMVGVAAVTDRWAGWQRIKAGDPAGSLAFDLMSTRDANSPEDRMPPIGTRIVPAEGVETIRAWIGALGAQ